MEPLENICVEPLENICVEPLENICVEPLENICVEPLEASKAHLLLATSHFPFLFINNPSRSPLGFFIAIFHIFISSGWLPHFLSKNNPSSLDLLFVASLQSSYLLGGCLTFSLRITPLLSIFSSLQFFISLLVGRLSFSP